MKSSFDSQEPEDGDNDHEFAVFFGFLLIVVMDGRFPFFFIMVEVRD